MRLQDLTHCTEVELRRFYVAACTERFLDVRLFIRNVGTIEFDGRVFKAGLKGQSDVYGFLFRTPWPMPLEIECKNVRTRETPEQIAWQTFCVSREIPYLKLRAKKDETPKQVIDRWVDLTGVWISALRDRP